MDQITPAQYKIMLDALALRMVDESMQAHRIAFLTFVAQGKKRSGKNKQKPVYRKFEQFFNYDREIDRVKNRKDRQSRLEDIAKLINKKEVQDVDSIV